MSIKNVTFHCSASKNGVAWDIDDIRKFHVKERGFRDIGYHYVIQPNGLIQQGRKLEEIGAHVQYANKGNIGVCLIGLDKFTLAQFESARGLFQALQVKLMLSTKSLMCHYEFESAKKQGKTCPNIKKEDLLDYFVNGDLAPIDNYILK